MTGPFARLGKLWRSRRVRIIASAIGIGLVCGAIQAPMPLEDGLFGVRAILRNRPADQTIAVVSLDDRTLQDLKANDAPRVTDAQLIDSLFASGARRIFFDRTYYFTESPEGDAALVAALKRHPGRVFMGAMPGDGDGLDKPLSMIPAAEFRDHVGVVSLAGNIHPAYLSVSFPFVSDTIIGKVPGMAAKLADVKTFPPGDFRPDYAIDYTTIPNFSYIDIVRGRVPADAVRGKDVVVAPSATVFHDYHNMPMRQYVSGALFHVIAAQTLKEGPPIDLGWLPAFLPVILIVVSGIGRGRSVDRYRTGGLVAVLIVVPFVLDHYLIQVEVMPAAITAAIAIFRARSLDREQAVSETNVVSGLPSLTPLRGSEALVSRSLVALKIRNYGAIVGTFEAGVEAALASEIQRRIRISDPDVTVHHEGGMFVWFSAIADPGDLFENLEGLHRIVRNGIQLEGRDIDLAFNCGVDTDQARGTGSRLAMAMQSAEEALRNDEIVCHYEPGTREAHWQVSLLSSLDRAIDNGEVWVAYQPKVDLDSGRVTGAEALVRWTHPERGPISPDSFIPLAEEYHRIERLTRFVLDQAVAAAVEINGRGHDFSVSVNLSAQLLRNADLPEMISQALITHGLPARRLTLEITETDRLDRTSRTYQMLQRITGMGIKLSIDDFGTGNATIDYLRYLPAQEVKIDKGFIMRLDDNREDLLLVQSIIEMAHSLGRWVVAEGVESAAILQLLRDLRCDVAQGYHISRPLPLADLHAFLAPPELASTG